MHDVVAVALIARLGLHSSEHIYRMVLNQLPLLGEYNIVEDGNEFGSLVVQPEMRNRHCSSKAGQETQTSRPPVRGCSVCDCRRAVDPDGTHLAEQSSQQRLGASRPQRALRSGY